MQYSLCSYLRLPHGARACLFVSRVAMSMVLATTQGKPILRSRSIANGVTLRILPLGDSITWGYMSSDGNGYRLDLSQKLSGNQVDFVGSLRSGSMANNYNEGHSGAVIAEIASCAQASLPQRPNVVLLMAGTNDINIPNNPSNAPARLGSLIDEVVQACPNAAVLVAQITPIADTAKKDSVKIFNATIPRLIAERVNAGKHVLVVNMSASVTTADLADGYLYLSKSVN